MPSESNDPRPPVRWEEYDLPGIKGGFLTHDPEPCVYVDGECSCGRLDLGVVRGRDTDEWVRLEGGTLDLWMIRSRAEAWPTWRWWKRYLPRRWWRRFGYIEPDAGAFIERYEREL